MGRGEADDVRDRMDRLPPEHPVAKRVHRQAARVLGEAWETGELDDGAWCNMCVWLDSETLAWLQAEAEAQHVAIGHVIRRLWRPVSALLGHMAAAALEARERDGEVATWPTPTASDADRGAVSPERVREAAATGRVGGRGVDLVTAAGLVPDGED